MSEPSEKAAEAACAAVWGEDWPHRLGGSWTADQRRKWMAHALQAAHTRALGLDRSVCLRDVVEALRRPQKVDDLGHDPDRAFWSDILADFIETEFTQKEQT